MIHLEKYGSCSSTQLAGLATSRTYSLLHWWAGIFLVLNANSLIIICQIHKISSNCCKIPATVILCSHKICQLFTWQCFQGRIQRIQIPISDGQWHKELIYTTLWAMAIKTNISDPLADACQGSKGLPLLPDKQILNMNRNGGTIKNLSSEFLLNENCYRFILLDNVRQLSISVFQTLVRRCTLPS